MNIFLPQNIFTELIADSITIELKDKLIFKPSSLITSETLKAENSIGLIPTMDLIKNRELFISEKYGLAFEGSLCNTYIYFKSDKEKIDEINLFGDISSLEVILSKILFKEIYNADIQIQIITEENKLKNQNFIITGNKNFENENFFSGVSFSEEIIEFLSLPFVNYVFASKNKKLIHKLNESLTGLAASVYKKIEEYHIGKNLSERIKEYVASNISSLVIDFTQDDIDGIVQLIRLPYYHGMIDGIIEPNFI